MFALGIHYLCGRAVATHPASRERAEWPPHPDRVFMALVAAHFEGTAAPGEREALLWLEKLDPPALAASNHELRASVTHFVPVNDAVLPRLRLDKEDPSAEQMAGGLALLPQFRARKPRRFPSAIPDDPKVHLLWDIAKPDAPTGEALAALCRKVTYVGHSSSLVQMWVEPNPPLATLRPASGAMAKHRLRVPGEGRLAELEMWFNAAGWREYRALQSELAPATGRTKAELKARLQERFGNAEPSFRRPMPSLWRGYESVGKQPTEEPETPGSCFDPALLILRRVEGPPLGLESTLQLTQAFRDTLMKHCPMQPPPGWLSGHAPDGGPSERPHLAFLPLSHVGREHADGHLLGLALALPREGASAEEQAACWSGLLYDDYGLAQPLPPLRLGRLGVWQLELDEREARPAALQPETWTRETRRWATVTPIALDRYPKGADKEVQMEETIRRACAHVGLPEPQDVIVSVASMFTGAPHARRFSALPRKNNGSFFHTHAILTFPAPVRGPILLGAGRYRGYGLCRPLTLEEA